MDTDLLAKLSTWSKARPMKSPNMISTMAASPASASPPPAPTIAPSLSGVHSTRSECAVDSPRVALNAPPYGSPTSSPSRYRLGSSSSRRCRARLRLPMTRSAGTVPPGAQGPGGDLAGDLVNVGADRGVELREVLRVRFRVSQVPVVPPHLVQLFLRSSVVALAVRAETVGCELDHAGSAPLAHVVHHRHQLGPDLVDVDRVHVLVGRAEGGCPAGDGARQLLGGRGGLRDAVVLDHHQQRQRPQHRHVQRLIDRSLAPGAVADINAGECARLSAGQVHRDA